MASATLVPLGRRAQPWGPEAYRLELISAIEEAILELLRAASPSATSKWPSPAAADAAPPGAVERRRARRLAERLRPLLRSRGRGTLPGALRLRRWLALLDSVHGLLSSGRHATSRELFYTHVGLFKRQEQSDDLIKNICRTLEVPRHYLRLAGTARGLVRGHLRILEPCLSRGAPGGAEDGGADVGSWVDGMEPLEPGGHSISPICAHLVRVEANARTVLVVEKETIFHRLLSEGLLERHRPCIMVTGRGFPDVPTRYLLRRIHEDLGCPRILVLADFDASGLSIGATYAFGPEDAWIQDDLALPSTVPLVCPGGAAGAARFGLAAADAVPLTARDTALASGLLRRLARLLALQPSDATAASVATWERAVHVLLDGGVKYELDAIDRLSEFVDISLRAEGTAAPRAVAGHAERAP